MAEDIVRCIRILEYIGPRSWLEQTFSRNAVKGVYKGRLATGEFTIREAHFEFPEIVAKGEEEIPL